MALAPDDIGRRIKAARDAKHWTQAELAVEAHVSVGTVSRWENGKLPPVRELIRLAGVLGVDPEYLVEPPETQDVAVTARLLAVEGRLATTEELLARIAKALGA